MRRVSLGFPRTAVPPGWVLGAMLISWTIPVSIRAATGVLAAATVAAAAAPPSASPGFWGLILDNLFAVTILLIFLGAILGAVINARRRDRVLKDFDQYHVTAVLQDGRRIQGIMTNYSNGVEFRYRHPYRNPLGNVHNSFILYQTEYQVVRSILRLESDLSAENRERRLTELIRYYNPTLARRSLRWSRKQFAILRDAFVKSFSLLIGQAKKVSRAGSAAGTLIASEDKQITEIGSTVISSVNLMNDPILERYIGRWCVAEIKEGDSWREIPGILKEYSTDWVELLEASWPREIAAVLPEGESKVEVPEANCVLRRDGAAVVLENQPPEALELIESVVNGETQSLDQRQVPPGESARIDAGSSDTAKVTVKLRCMEPSDVILPRSLALIRHAGRREHISWLQAIGLRRRSPRARRAERLARRKLDEV